MKALHYLTIGVLLLFGGLTVFLTSSVLLDLFGIRQREGNFVPFIVWANLICGGLYFLAASGLWKFLRWSTAVLGAATLLLAGAFAALHLHIRAGGAFEAKTVSGMTFRIGFTALATVVSAFIIRKHSSQ